MKPTSLLLLLLTTITGCSQKPKAFTIEGDLKNPAGEFVYLSIKRDWFFWPYDTSRVENGHFSFKGKLYNPTMAMIGYTGSVRGPDERLFLFINKGENAVASTDGLSKASASGSEEQPLFRKIMDDTQELRSRWYQAYFRQAGNGQELRDLGRQLIAKYRAFVAEHRGSYAALRVVETLDEVALENPSLQRELFESLSVAVKNSRIGKSVESSLAAREKFFVGARSGDFVLSDTDGKPVRFSEFRGKVTLLEFGASWCGPCRAEYPFIQAMYKRYAAQGLRVLSVSLDKEKAAWLGAHQADKVPWTSVSDLRGFQGEVPLAWDVTAIPANFIVDAQGRIFGTDWHGEDLEQKVRVILEFSRK